MAQEALCNARKHSRATCTWLSVSYTPSVVVLTVRDNGRGFATQGENPEGHGHTRPAAGVDGVMFANEPA